MSSKSVRQAAIGDEVIANLAPNQVPVDEKLAKAALAYLDSLDSGLDATSLWVNSMVQFGQEDLEATEEQWIDFRQKELLHKLECMENVSNALVKLREMGIDFSPPEDFIAKKIKTMAEVERFHSKQKKVEEDSLKKLDKHRQNLLKKFGKKIQNVREREKKLANKDRMLAFDKKLQQKKQSGQFGR